MNTTGIRFISSNSSSGGSVGVGLSTIRGPTGPAGAFGGPQGIQGPMGSGGVSTGPQGFQGSVGVQGLRGSTGSDGVTGSRGYQGSKGDVGQGFIVFSTTSSYTGLNTIIATGGNVGEFVLITGGELFVYMGTGAGSTGPGVSYQYAGDVTDESKLVGVQGPQGLRGSTGSNGLQGLIGPTGSNGSNGLQGLIGPTGSNGSNGVQGLIGPTGSVGLQGPPGSGSGTGSQGTQGFQGFIGPQGIPGAAVGSLANVKLSYTRTNDSPSVSGAGIRLYAFSGATGIFNTPSSNISFTPSNGRFTVSEQGDYYFDSRIIIKGNNNPDFITTDVYVNSNTGPIYTYTHVAYGIVSPVAFPIAFYTPLNSGDYIHLSCYSTGTAGPINFKAGTTMNLFRLTNGPSGPQGSIGPQGPPGAGSGTGTQGLQGPTGSNGVQGLIGPTGSNGVQGLIGPTGSNGSNGVQGLIGPTGSDGFNGLQGPTGSNGVQGLIGPTGSNGSNGVQGLIGPTGSNGNNGVQGLQGPTGSDGVQGLQGLVGPTGSNGSIGPQGVSGFQGLVGATGSTGSIGPQGFQGLIGSTGSIGVQGTPGSNGASSFLTLYLDTAGGSYSVAQTGSLMVIPNQSTQTSITSGNQTNTTINIANFISSGILPSAIIEGGNWNLGLFGISNAVSAVSTYFEAYYVDSDGVSNQTLLAAGTGTSAVFLPVSQTLTTNSLYIPATILPDTTKRILIKVFLIFNGNNRNATLEFRDGTISNLHTTILSPNIAAGQNTQITYNQSGSYTGSSNLTYDYTNNIVTLPNVTASSGSFTNLHVNSGNVHIGLSAGSVNQKTSSIAIGNSSGQTNQGTGTSSQGYSIAIGHLSGNNNQGYGSVSIGYSSGQTNQKELAVSIGTSSGNISQGLRSIGIGQGAGYQYQGNYSISMGDSSGQDYQGTESVSIGRSSGLTYQNPYSVAIGPYAGQLYQSTGNVNGGSVAIGSHAGQTLQQYQSVAIGYYAGQNNQGANSIAIGANAGYNNQASNSIVINASGNQINGTGTGFFVNPIRNNTGSSLLMYNTANSEISYTNTVSQNIIISASNNATGSSTGALVVSGGVNVNGESVFNNIVYAPSLNPNFINRGNPGQASPLLLSNYNTVHYYSTTSATGFIDISTTMVENAVYEVEFNCIGASASNDDMFFYPNYNTSFGSTTFYSVYTQSSGSPSIAYTTNNQNAFYFDYVGGSIGWEPVGKIRIYNNRSAKKVKVEVGDTTAIVNGQGYWTSGSGFTNNSVSSISYDTSTQWSNVGRLAMSAGYGITFTNWNVWVKRIM